jgi:hypothetical protein
MFDQSYFKTLVSSHSSLLRKKHSLHQIEICVTLLNISYNKKGENSGNMSNISKSLIIITSMCYVENHEQ